MPRRAERIVKRGKNTEKSHAINEQVNDLRKMEIRISRRENDGEYQDDLKGRSQLAKNTGRKWTITRDKQNHYGHHKNQNVAAKNDNSKPPSDLFLERQNNERRRKQQLIGDRIEISAKRRALIQAAREQAVDSVRKPRHNKHQQSPFIFLIGNKNKKERQEAEPQQSDLIGNRPDAAFHCNSG